MSKDTIVCRCEDVSLAEIEEAIEEGYTEIEALKRHLRVGMGPCQGRTCTPLIMSILARKTGTDKRKIEVPIYRPPAVPTPIKTFAGEEG